MSHQEQLKQALKPFAELWQGFIAENEQAELDNREGWTFREWLEFSWDFDNISGLFERAAEVLSEVTA